MNSKEFERALSRSLREKGFQKHRKTWHKDQEVTIAVINLQKSQWGEQFYINLGIYVKRLGPLATPKEYECPSG